MALLVNATHHSIGHNVQRQPLLLDIITDRVGAMNIVLITDDHGDTVDVNTYCSDTCAQTDPLYQGWFGCVEAAYDTACVECGEAIVGV